MNDQPTEEILSPEDEAKVLEFSKQLDDQQSPEVPNYHPLLKVWNDVLAPAQAERLKKVTPQWASKMVATYPGLRIQDCEYLRDVYFGMLDELKAVLEWEISLDPHCLSYDSPAEDAEENAHHYKNILLNWQLMFLQYELEWECTDESAAADLAAISETHKTLFGAADRPGLVAFLDNIGFEYDESDQADLTAALEELRGSGE